MKNKGITLIALVITIIIMLILAGVVISLTIGDKGIVKIAKNAAKNYIDSAEIEKNQISEFENILLNELDKNKEEDIYTQLKVGDYVNYPVYYDNVQIKNASTGDLWTLKDEYNGWRILSIDKEKNTVRLVSAGIPISYYHKNVNSTSVGNLTTNFFSTPIVSSTYYNFDSCGFKTAQNGTRITNINDVKLLFTNGFTAVYGEGETYTDNGNTYTYTGGNPKVQAMTKQDMDTVLGYTTAVGTVFNNDLLTVLSTGHSYGMVPIYLASAGSTLSNDYEAMYGINSHEGISSIVSAGFCMGSCGVRPVVTLKANVKFTKAKNNINNTQTWDIAI